MVFGPVSGCVLNPAVGMLSLMAPISGRSIPSSAWVYFIAPPVAAFIAAMHFRLVSPKDHAPRKALMHGPVDHRVGDGLLYANVPPLHHNSSSGEGSTLITPN